MELKVLTQVTGTIYKYQPRIYGRNEKISSVKKTEMLNISFTKTYKDHNFFL